jgi:hypothetical protein
LYLLPHPGNLRPLCFLHQDYPARTTPLARHYPRYARLGHPCFKIEQNEINLLLFNVLKGTQVLFASVFPFLIFLLDYLFTMLTERDSSLMITALKFTALIFEGSLLQSS